MNLQLPPNSDFVRKSFVEKYISLYCTAENNFLSLEATLYPPFSGDHA